MTDWIALVASFVICFAAAGIGGMFTTRNIKGWYRGLRKPSWNPPDWAFGPVWSILYALMAVSVWLVWDKDGSSAFIPISIFAIQLVLNVAWSWLFFYKKNIKGGFIEVLVFWAAILATIVAFIGSSLMASLLLLPYIVWVSIASYLNYTILKLNPAGNPAS